MWSNIEAPISHSALDALLRLRGVLARALRDADDRSQPGQHLSLVALDGACEQAIRLCAAHRGLGLKPQISFYDALNQLANALPGWERTAVRGVIELHDSRNRAQHMAVLPAQERIAGWTSDAEAFICELVGATFGLALADVLLADAVRDEELRALLGEAERQMNAGDARSAFRYADHAFGQARLRWREQQTFGEWTQTHFGVAQRPIGLPGAGEPADLLEVQPFASDMSRYAQMLTTRRHMQGGGPDPDENEVSSTLSFVLDWVLRWEVFDAGYPAERYAAFWDTVSAPATDDGGPPRIAWHLNSYLVETGAGRSDEYECEFQLANVPREGEFRWGLDLPAALAAASDQVSSQVRISLYGLDPRGVMRVRVPVETDIEALVEILSRAVEIATARHERRAQDIRSWRGNAADLRERYVRVLREASPVEGVFAGVEVMPELSPDGVRYIVSLEIDSPTLFDLNLASRIFSGQGGYLAASTYQAGRIVFEDFPFEQEPVEALGRALRDSAQEIMRYRQLRAEAESGRQQFISQLNSKLGSVPRATAVDGRRDFDES